MSEFRHPPDDVFEGDLPSANEQGATNELVRNDSGALGEVLTPGGNASPRETIEAALRLLFRDDDVFEIRALNCADRIGSTFTSTISGYYQFAHLDRAAADIAALDAKGTASVIYVTLNPVSPALLARAVNRLKTKAKETTSDKDVVRRRWILIDCDPVRPSGISSTDAELKAAVAKAEQVEAFLNDRGWPAPIVAMSGNGIHLLYAINLPTEDDDLVKRVLSALAERFDDSAVNIDRSVHNPARITKVIGTVAASKGDSMVGVPGVEDRPHRRAVLLRAPKQRMEVPGDALEDLAGATAAVPSTTSRRELPPPSVAKAANPPHGSPRFDRFDLTPGGVRAYLDRHGVTVTGERRNGSATYLYLQQCPVVSDCGSTGGTDIAVIVGDDGKIAYKNLHNRGEGLGWIDVRESLEPGYRDHVLAARQQIGRGEDGVGGESSVGITVSERWSPPLPLHERAPAFPISTAFPAGTEPVRDYVEAIATAFQVPIDLPAMLVPAAIGLSMAQVVVIRLGPEWAQPPNHYNAVLMEPGNRKSGPFHEICQPIVAWEQSEGERQAPAIAEYTARTDIMRRRCERLKDLASGKVSPRRNSDEPTGREAEQEAIALEQELAERKPMMPPQLIIGDVTPDEVARVLAANGERTGVFSDESEAIEVFLGRYGDKPNIQIYNKGYDGSPHRVNRVSRSAVLLKRPLISTGLVIQPEGVRDLLSNQKAKGTGLVARFAMALPRSLLGHRTINPAAISPVLREKWGGAVLALLQQELSPDGPLEVRLSPEASVAFHDFCAHIEPELSWCGEFAAFNMQDWGGKLCGRIGRIALTLHGLRYGLGFQDSLLEPVSKETMTAAIAWAPYLIEHAKITMGWLGIDQTSVNARRVLAWIARTNTDRFTKQACFTGVRNAHIMLADEVNEPLGLLCDLHYLRRLPDPAQRERGRPASPEFVVNPTWNRESI